MALRLISKELLMGTTEDKREGFYLSEDGEWVPDRWTNSPLNQVVSDFIDYRGKTPTKTNSGIPLITAKVVKDGRVFQTQEYIAESEYDSWMRRGIPEAGDVILTTEAPLGEVAFIPEGKIALAQRIITLRGKEDELDNRFLKYSLQSPLMQYRLTARESGSTVSGIKSSELKVTDLLHPEDFNEQKSISAVLGSLDDKIELLREQNETLETLAQTLFKRWFIDFNFPDANGNPYKDSGGTMMPSEFGEIPKGWRVGKLAEGVYVRYGKDHKVLNGGEYPCYGSGGIMRYVERTLCDNESVLIPRKGTLSNLMYVREPFWSVDTMFFTEFRQDNFVKYFYLLMDRVNLEDMNVGSAVPSMTTAVLNEMRLIYPDAQNLKNFEGVCEELYAKAESNTQQIKTLSQLRDTLLPRLMKGEIRILIES